MGPAAGAGRQALLGLRCPAVPSDEEGQQLKPGAALQRLPAEGRRRAEEEPGPAPAGAAGCREFRADREGFGKVRSLRRGEGGVRGDGGAGEIVRAVLCGGEERGVKT